MVATTLFSAALLAGMNLVRAQGTASVEQAFEFPGIDGTIVSGVGAANATVSGTPLPGAVPPVNESAGRCVAISFGFSDIKNQMAIVESVEMVSSYVCGEEPVDPVKAASIATATATAFAIAVAEASVFCDVTGDVEFYARAYSNATAAADVWLAAYAKAFAEASDCDKCTALAESFGYIEQEVFLKAVAASEATVNGYTTASAPQLFALSRQFNIDVQSATATAFAAAIADAKTFYDGSQCYAWVNTNGCIYTPAANDPEKCFDCEAVSIGATTAIGIDAVAIAASAAGVFTCGTNTSAEAEAYVAASALAEATAEAMSFAYASCTSTDGAFGCAASVVAAEDTARAVAEAFASAWAGGYTCEETCIVDSDTAARAIGEILVSASTTALVELCAAEGEQWTVAVLAEIIETASLEAVASSISSAVIGGDECFAFSGVEVIVAAPEPLGA